MASVSFRTVTVTGTKYNWSSSNNWNPQAPAGGDDVTLASGNPNLATYTSLYDLSSLTLNTLTVNDSGVTLEIGSGDTLTVQNGITNAGAIDVDGSGSLILNANLTNSGTIDVAGIFTLSNINSNTGSIVAQSGGQINLTNVAAGNYTVQTGGEITISSSGNINGDPTFFIQGGLLETLSNTPGQADANFAGSAAGHLAINTQINGNPYNNQLDNLGLGDTIEFNDVNITGVSLSGLTLTLTWAGGSRNVTIHSFDPSLTNPDFILSTDPVTGQAAAEVVCFLRGTRIRTPDGTKPVELLLIGDKVLTADGATRAVRWLWRQTVVTSFADELRAYPICIMAGALDENVPQRDLFLSPDHAILLDRCLVQAAALVNNTTIVRIKNPEPRFVYYHVELEDHALILAEGVASETYVDNVTRRRFDNYADYEAMYGPDELTITEMDVPRAKSARQLPRVVRERLAARSAALSVGVQEAA
jgi:hypothetical protein